MDNENEWNLELSEYIKQGDISKTEKTKNWQIAIGLQDVDGLTHSKYLIETAKEHIEGYIDIKEAKNRINEYYEEQAERESEERVQEADKVAVRIAEILSENTFNFNITELLNIHKRLFEGIYDSAGSFRQYNFTKKEWVLNGDTVLYTSYEAINDTLSYDLLQEKNFSYKDLSLNEAIKHICRFTADIWQVHPFCEGNTRTTAVYIIKYLKSFGFNINNQMFASNSWYFRNALVRANYKNFEKNVFEDISFLEKFFLNLLTDSNYELRNRDMHIYSSETDKEEKLSSKQLTLEEQAIINIIRENSDITQENIAKSINKSLRTVKSIMLKMQEKGLIQRENGKRNGIWCLKI